MGARSPWVQDISDKYCILSSEHIFLPPPPQFVTYSLVRLFTKDLVKITKCMEVRLNFVAYADTHML